MKRKALVIFFVFTVALLLSCSRSKDVEEVKPTPEVPTLPGDVEALRYVFDIEALPEIVLEVTTAQWNTLLSNFDTNPQNEEYIMANYLFTKTGKEAKIDSVGIRIRGNTSRRRPEGARGEAHNGINPSWHHAHFAINFKKYVKSKRFNTLQKINLKWFKDDPTYSREVYCYDLFERYGIWTAPKSSYVRLTIKIREDGKAAYFGVYQLVESVDEDYIANRKVGFGDMDGFLWKANYGAHLRNADQSRMGVEDVKLDANLSKYFVYDLKTNDKRLAEAKAQLASFIQNFNVKAGADFQSWLQGQMDVQLFLKTYAVSVMVGMWDDYWGNSNNFYLYFNASGKFFFIPYDYDNTLGTSLIVGNSGTQDPTNWGKDINPIVKKILSIPAYRSAYISYLNELANPNKDLFAFERSVPRIARWQSMVSRYVANDTKEDNTIEDRPASWGNCGFYRLLSGDGAGGGAEANFFKTKIRSIPAN